jgi:cytochrome c oxidase subunit I+III
VALAFLSFGIWVHHMFTVGIPHLALAFFSATSALVAVPTAVQIFAWLATLAHGKPRWDLPMLYVFGFFFVFVIGGLTGVMLAMVPFNSQAHDTHFVVAHLHYVLIGGFVFPMLAALYYWLPHVTGRRAMHSLGGAGLLADLRRLQRDLSPHAPDRPARHAAAGATPTPSIRTGSGSTSSHRSAAFSLAMGFALVAADIVLQARFGRRAARDPWQGGTLDWAIPRPPAPYAFASLPSVEVRADRLDAHATGRSLAAGEGYLAFARNGWQESLGVHVTRATPDQVIILPRATKLPLVTASVLGCAVLAMLFQVYWLAGLFAAVVCGLFVYAAQTAGQPVDHGPLDIGRGLAVPPHTEVHGPPPWYALIFAIVADAAIFTSLLYAAFYNWLVADGWPPPALADLGFALPLATAAALVAAPPPPGPRCAPTPAPARRSPGSRCRRLAPSPRSRASSR